VHCRTVDNENLISKSFAGFIQVKYPFLEIRGSIDERILHKHFNIKMLLSCLLYSYLNYDKDNIIYIKNLEYINLFLTYLEGESITGIFIYGDHQDKNPFGFEQFNIFSFIMFVINRFTDNHKIILNKYFTLGEDDISYSLTEVNLLKNNSFILSKREYIHICNTSLIIAIDYLLETLKIRTKSSSVSRSSPIHKKRKTAKVPTSSQSNSN